MNREQEAFRQRELDRYRVVDGLPDEAYEDIVRLAASVCDAPTALLSMIDRDRQWFKARTGFDRAQTRRDEAFCDHAIRAPEQLLEVRDATQDARFRDNPLVTGPDGVRFYAGMPLVTPAGAAIGTVCVLDRTPRALNDVQRAALSALARLAMNLIEARHRERELERALQLGANAPESAPAAAVDHALCTVAIFEVQEAGAAIQRLGERAFERLLDNLHERLQAQLRGGHGDSVSRVSGCAEMIAVLHGADTRDALATLDAAAAEFAAQAKVRVLSASSAALDAGEALGAIFLRADEALSAAKDAG